MASRYDLYWRLEPDERPTGPAAGFAAAVHDPAWFLARQWQLGEHQGENAGSPVLVRYDRVDTRLEPAAELLQMDPTAVPAEAIVEAEPDDWWTLGRRLRIGAIVADRAGLDLSIVDADYLLDPPPPYDGLAGGLDGLAAWRDPARLGIDRSRFAGLGVPDARPLLWDPAELVYDAEFPLAGGGTALLPRHRGGRVDWFSADMQLPDGAAGPAGEATPCRAYPTALHYPGAPADRWWEIEDAAVDIGGFPPDSSHFATTLLIDLIASHSTDWFLFPVDSLVGHVQTLPAATVTDGFGRSYPIDPPADDWWLFRSTGLDTHSLTVWLRAMTPIDGPPIEDVLLGVDEYANLLWAVERRIDGHDPVAPARTAAEEAANPTLGVPDRRAQPAAAPSFTYVPGQDAAPFWHPYEIEERPDADGRPHRRFVQRRPADLARTHPELLRPAPRAELLRVHTPEGETVHEIEPATVPSIGMVLERHYRLARDTAGNPVLWVQRQRLPFLRPPSRTSRFDVLTTGPTAGS